MLDLHLAPRAPLLAPGNAPPVEWVVTPGLTQYPDALAEMEARSEAIARGEAAERVWLIEHPPLYTAGTSAKDSDLIDARFPVYRAGRGGQFTYHGPGQRVAYVMLDLKRRRPDVRAYVATLESWLIETLKAFDVVGETRKDRVGVWVDAPGQTDFGAGRNGRGQDRRDRRPGPALGDASRRGAERRPRSHPFLRHRALRDSGAALRRHQPPRPRPRDDDGASGRGSARSVRNRVRPDLRIASRASPLSFALARDARVRFRASGLPPRTAETIGVTWISASGCRRRAAVCSGRLIYARRRLLSEHAAPLAPAHYALIGERRGYRPNGFFDPNHFRKLAQWRSKRELAALLELYLAEPGPNAPSPSAEFDHAWYMSQNPDWNRTHTHPFLHFLERGMPAGKRPRAGHRR